MQYVHYIGLKYLGPVVPLASGDPNQVPRRYSPWNFLWTWADMEKIRDLSLRGYSAGDIAHFMRNPTRPVTSYEIIALCQRNGITVKLGGRGV